MAASLLNCPFPFSDSRKNNYFGPKACGPGSWASRTQAATLARLVRVWGTPGPAGSVHWAGPGPGPCAGVTIWYWDCRTGF